MSLILQGFYHTPRAARSAVLTRLIGWRKESDNNLAWASGSVRLSRYSAWRKARSRPLDLAAMDAPRSSWQDADPIHLYLSALAPSVELNATISALRNQIFPHWVLHVLAETQLELPDDPRICTEHSDAGFEKTPGLIGYLRAGDELPSYSLACLHETAHPP
jgi:hypothetical protein